MGDLRHQDQWKNNLTVRPPGPMEEQPHCEDEDRIRVLLALCYDDGVYPTDLDPGEMTTEGREVTFTLNTSLDTIKVRWLKEITVSVIFKDNARFLPRKVKDDTIRAFENGWIIGTERFAAKSRRGRVKIEGPNALSYVAKSRQVAEFMIKEGGVDIPLGTKIYKVLFKPWMTRAEFRDLRRQEYERTFWVVAVQIPLDDMPFIYAQVEKAIGRIIQAYPPDADPQRPALVNTKFDIDPEARGNMKDKICIKTSTEDLIEVKLACSTTTKCRGADNSFRKKRTVEETTVNRMEKEGTPTNQISKIQHSRGQEEDKRDQEDHNTKDPSVHNHYLAS
ncbi:hypothetical protein CBR_g26309 [Chara braunii]|uniref:Uncharacterized protein n=1 Tax=Chara braunii TaxID=69332 RepID=A0A388L7M2_CHABU|nr:hypothetical protein CBR_g26309 [Chara braunii]|eukprot:GBG78278.1 hypothetical protein CBR_g26309 [Chara braunii]